MRDDGAYRPDVRVVGGLPRPTWREAATIVSVPVLLLIVHFLVQPMFDTWMRLKYVRYTVAQTTPVRRLAPEPFTPYAWAWHELTRVAHALVHDPSGYHTHVIGNVVLIMLAAWVLLLFLATIGLRSWFTVIYWELVLVSPIVGSYAFDLFGMTTHGYGASTVGFAFLGTTLTIGIFTLWSQVRSPLGQQTCSSRDFVSGNSFTPSPLMVMTLLFVVGLVIALDLFTGSPATPVHQSGAGFGALVGSVTVVALRGSV